MSVSVIIPTHGRPNLLVRAVRSALEQTVSPHEVIVIIDGPDQATTTILNECFPDGGLKVRILRKRQGGGAARNAGIDWATGRWIAFLDDDDEWLPKKLERQLKAVVNSQYANPVCVGLVYYDTPRARFVWPTTLPAPDQHISDYLFTRRRLFQGEAYLPTPTFLAPRTLLEQVPFRADLPRHQDTDWLLRVFCEEGVGLEFITEPIAIVHAEEPRPAISEGADWQESLNWALSNRFLFTKRAFSGFLLTVVSSSAAKQRRWSSFAVLLSIAWRLGSPTATQVALHVGVWIVPQSLRRVIRARLAGLMRAS